MRMRTCRLVAASAAALASAAIAAAGPAPRVEMRDGWIRTPRDGYASTVAFATLRTSRDLELIGARIDGFTEVKLKGQPRMGDTIVQQEVRAIPIAAGPDVELALGAGRFHLMPIGLRRPLVEGDRLAATLRFAVPGATGAQATTEVRGSMVVRTPAGFHPHREEDEH